VVVSFIGGGNQSTSYLLFPKGVYVEINTSMKRIQSPAYVQMTGDEDMKIGKKLSALNQTLFPLTPHVICTQVTKYVCFIKVLDNVR
jgi:hypothetical protein